MSLLTSYTEVKQVQKPKYKKIDITFHLINKFKNHKALRMISALDFQKAAAQLLIKEAKDKLQAAKLEAKQAAKENAKLIKEAERQAKLDVANAEKQKKLEQKLADQAAKQALKTQELQAKMEARLQKEKERLASKAQADSLCNVPIPNLSLIMTNGELIYHSIKLNDKSTDEVHGVWTDGKVDFGGQLLPPQAFLTAHSLDLISKGLIKRHCAHNDMWDVKGHGLYVKKDAEIIPVRLLKAPPISDKSLNETANSDIDDAKSAISV